MGDVRNNFINGFAGGISERRGSRHDIENYLSGDAAEIAAIVLIPMVLIASVTYWTLKVFDSVSLIFDDITLAIRGLSS